MALFAPLWGSSLQTFSLSLSVIFFGNFLHVLKPYGRPGSVQQQYRPMSPTGAPTQGNATSYDAAGDAAIIAEHTEPVNQGANPCVLASFGSLDNVKPSEVPTQIDVLNSVSTKGTWVADSPTPTILTKGYLSPPFTLQFGTFSPGVINKQVCMDSGEVFHRTLSPPTQQQCQNQEETKDRVHTNQSDTTYKYPATKPKISVQIPASYTPNLAPPQFMLPMPGRSMNVAFQQKQHQVPIEFRGTGFEMQSIGCVSNSLPVKMAIPVGNAPHIQPMFVHGTQPRALHQQTFIHQGQGFGCAPPANCHLPQFGNARFAQELSQLHTRSSDDQKRIVKITHPETHEELMLDRRGHSFMGIPISSQMPLYYINQLPQPVQTFSPVQKVYYPKPCTYNSTPIYHPNTTSVPLASRQISSKMQPLMHSFDSTNSNQPITSMKPPMSTSCLDASSRKVTNSHTSSEVSSFKGLLPSLSAPVHVELKPPITFPVEKNEVSLKCTGESMSNQQSNNKIGLAISPEAANLVSTEVNLKAPDVTYDISCNSLSQKVPTQWTQSQQDSIDHVRPIVGPQTISTSNQPLASTKSSIFSVKAKPSEMEESSVITTSSTSQANLESSHTEASSRSDSVVCTVTSLISNIDVTSVTNRNSKYHRNSILGKPPVIYTQEMVSPKFLGSTTLTEDLRKENANPVSFLETNPELNDPVSLQNQDFMVKEHVVTKKGMYSMSTTEQVHATMRGIAFGSEEGTGIAKLGRLQACHESLDSHHIISIDMQTSSNNQQPLPDAQIVTFQPENKQNDSINVKSAAPITRSSSSLRKIEHANVDSKISNPCSAAAPSMVQTKKIDLELTKAKNTNGRRKKLKEMLLKASGQKHYDLDSVANSVNENIERFNKSEDIESFNLKQNCSLDAKHDSSTCDTDSQNKADLFDLEDTIKNSIEKLKEFEYMYSINGVEVNNNKCEFDHKRYSRDFLLTLAQSCIELPAGFKSGFDISEVVMSVHVGAPYIDNIELNPNHARIKYRGSATSRANRHMANKVDDDKWRKQFSSHVSGRNYLSDNVLQPVSSSQDAIQCVGHGYTRNLLQSQPFISQYSGEVLSRTVKEVAQCSMSRGSVEEKWQHKTNAQGILSPSQVSVPLMRKAEKKYEISKVSDEEEAKQRQLKGILNKLTPQSFEKLFAQVKELNIDNIVTLTGVISQIFDKALMEPTFCEMYASFCFRLAGDLPNFVKDDEKITFKRLLLNKCQEEFERGEREQAEADKVAEEGGMKQSEGEREEKRLRARRRMLGNIRLIGELYKKKMLTERIMHECINKLLGEYQNPDEEDLEALCKLMSTIGEMIDHSRAKVHMDFYFDLIQKLSENLKLSPRIRFMLEDVIDLRKNKWRQRRKVEGPKKIDEIRRDAVKHKLGQSNRFGSSPNFNSPVACISSGLRPRPFENSTRGSSVLSSRRPSQVCTYGSQNINLDAKYQPSNRTLPVPHHQRRSDRSIRLGSQGDLGKGMLLCGKPPVSNDILPEVHLNSHHGQTLEYSKEDLVTGAARNRTNFKSSNTSWVTSDYASPQLSTVGQKDTSSTVKREIAKDKHEVVLCMKEFNAPSFYPSLVSLWINDSFERKDLERELLATLLVFLCKSQENLLSRQQLLHGYGPFVFDKTFQHVISTLEDVVTDAPKATKFLGGIFAKVIMEEVISLTDIGGLLQEPDGGDKPAGRHALDDSLTSEVLGSMLESIRVERGDSAVDLAKFNLQCPRRPDVCL
ncbi:hypothetical protein C2845_PM15G16160 [Panicum miliaceum]|uniref:Eukaryotic translation initiation factor 4G n=1 Tax=Panicum miliaceum TaxID=4540 RepID=A0A3L6Q4A8_PANMI|nr:hypothetical protein C2845_PM15G16160 [Panicum miliaceum]